MPSLHRDQSSDESDVFYSSGSSSEIISSRGISGSRKNAKTSVPRRMSSEESGVFFSDGFDWQTSRDSRSGSGSRRNTSRHDHSSGYESLPDSSHYRRSSSTKSSGGRQRSHSRGSQRSPPPRYVELPGLDLSEEWSTGSERFMSTVIEAPEEIDQVKFSGRDSPNAPDMILNRASVSTSRSIINRRSRSSSVQMKINGRSVEYATMSLATEQEAKNLLIEHVKSKWLLRNDIAHKCLILDKEASACFRYHLTTQHENRDVVEVSKPFEGQKVPDFIQQSISPWDYEIDRPGNFRNDNARLEVPNTQKVKTCEKCDGSRKSKCYECHGQGSLICHRCYGNGREPMSSRVCMQCSGGYEICSKCTGSGICKCSNCNGNGRVISQSYIDVKWSISQSKYIDSIENIPDKLLEKAVGNEVLRREDDQLNCLGNGEIFHKKIRQHSKAFVKEHQYKGGAIIRQRHTVEVIPIQSIDCAYKNSNFRFYLVGMNRKVYLPEFPKRRLASITRLFS